MSRPLRDISDNSRTGIRLVPYSPPRLDDEESCSPSTKKSAADELSVVSTPYSRPRVSSVASPPSTSPQPDPGCSPEEDSSPRPSSKRQCNHITVHPNKTFTLEPTRYSTASTQTDVPPLPPLSDAAISLKSPPPSLATISTWHSGGRPSFDIWSDDEDARNRSYSPDTCALTTPDRSLSPRTPSPVLLKEDVATAVVRSEAIASTSVPAASSSSPPSSQRERHSRPPPLVLPPSSLPPSPSRQGRQDFGHDTPATPTSATFKSALIPAPTPTTPVPATTSITTSTPTPVLPTNTRDSAASFRGFRMHGGIRRVPSTPNLNSPLTTPARRPDSLTNASPGTVAAAATAATTDTVLFPLSEFPAVDNAPSFSRRSSVASTWTVSSTSSETPNVQVYDHSSPVQYRSDNIIPLTLTDDDCSPVDSLNESRPFTSDSDQNYIVHATSPPASAPSPTAPSRTLPSYSSSQESLGITPLRTSRKKSLNGGFGYYKSRSRETLRARANSNSSRSARSFRTVSSGVIGQEVSHAVVIVPDLIDIPPLPNRPQPSASWAGFRRTRSNVSPAPSEHHHPFSSLSPSSAVTATAKSLPSRVIQMLQSHPHQWSSQLSTVLSESEDASVPSRSISALSGNGSTYFSHARLGSATWYPVSRVSSYAEEVASLPASWGNPLSSTHSQHARSHSRSASYERPDRPQASYQRPNPLGSRRTVRDQDEHGDGLADLDAFTFPSWPATATGHAAGEQRVLHSSSSSSSLASVYSTASVPAWARIYYGLGEPRFLRTPSILSGASGAGGAETPRTSSVFPSNSQTRRHSRHSHQSSLNQNVSALADHFPLPMQHKSRRMRQMQPSRGDLPFSDAASLEIPPVAPEPPAEATTAADGYRGIMRSADISRRAPSPANAGAARAPPSLGVIPTLRRRTSSLWSPHLRTDRHATSRYSLWDPPSTSLSVGSGIAGKRNTQVILFIVGFVFPLAWMIAAFLPLPVGPRIDMEEGYSQVIFGASLSSRRQRVQPDQQARYDAVRWWRNLNRIMSVFGLMIVGAVIGLAVVGARQGLSRAI